MRRSQRHKVKDGLADERRRLISSYMSDAAEPVPPPVEAPPAEEIAVTPEAREEATLEADAPLETLFRPPSTASRRPPSFGASRTTLEEVARLCEELAQLRAEVTRRRAALAAAARPGAARR